MIRIKTNWLGLGGGPAVTNLYFDEPVVATPAANACAAAVRQMFAAFAGVIPSSVTLDFDATAQLLDPETGFLKDEINLTKPANLTGGANSERVGPAGALINWKTGTVLAGRRVRGKTFLVPLSTSIYDGGGLVKSTSQTLINGGANILVGNAIVDFTRLVIWKRPVNKVGGAQANVTSASVASKACVLTSRRD